MFGFGKKEEIGPRCATANGRAAYEGLGGGNWPHVNFKNFCLLEDENDFNVYWNWLQQIWNAHIDNSLLQSEKWRTNLPKIIYYHFVEFWLLGGGQQTSLFADNPNPSNWYERQMDDYQITEYSSWVELDPLTKMADVWNSDDDHRLRNRFFDLAAYLEEICLPNDWMGVAQLKNPLNFDLPLFTTADVDINGVEENLITQSGSAQTAENTAIESVIEVPEDNSEPFDDLASAKKLFDEGLIDTTEYKALKKKILGI